MLFDRYLILLFIMSLFGIFSRLLILEINTVCFVNIFKSFSDFFKNLIRDALNQSIVETSACPSSNLLNFVFLELYFTSLLVPSLNSCKYDFFYIEVKTHSDSICSYQIRGYSLVKFTSLLFSALRRQSTVYHCYF